MAVNKMRGLKNTIYQNSSFEKSIRQQFPETIKLIRIFSCGRYAFANHIPGSCEKEKKKLNVLTISA